MTQTIEQIQQHVWKAAAAAAKPASGKHVLADPPSPSCDVTPDEVTPVVQFLLGTLRHWYRFRNGGNQWSYYVAFLSFFRHVAKLPLDYSKWQHYEAAAVHGGPRFMHERFCIVSDRPLELHKDDQHRPHREDGPSHIWSDGVELYHWHGTRVPARLIVEPESYTAEEIKAIDNTEVFRAMAERLDWDKTLEKLGSKTLDSWQDPKTKLHYELVEATIAGESARFLRKESPETKTGERPHYMEPVHEGLKTAQAARKWQAMAAFLDEGDEEGARKLVDEANKNPDLEYKWEV